MTEGAPQLKTSTLRGAMEGISLLLLVAMALQATPGFTERAVVASNGHAPVIRMIAVSLRSERVVRRQDERPAPVQAHPAVTPERRLTAGVAVPDLGVTPRPLDSWLINLPPPALA